MERRYDDSLQSQNRTRHHPQNLPIHPKLRCSGRETTEVRGMSNNKEEAEMEGEKTTRCEFCGKIFEAGSFNKYHQKYCTDSRCVNTRKRERQRAWHHKKRQTDIEWKKEIDKCTAERHREKRMKKRAQEEARLESEFEWKEAEKKHAEFVTGLVALLTTPKTFEELADTFKKIEICGKKIISSAPLNNDHSTNLIEYENGKIIRHPIPKNLCVIIKGLQEKSQPGHSTLIAAATAEDANFTHSKKSAKSEVQR